MEMIGNTRPLLVQTREVGVLQGSISGEDRARREYLREVLGGEAPSSMNTIDTLKIKERLAQLRIKWSKAKEKEDVVMMSVIEKQARALKIGAKLEK